MCNDFLSLTHTHTIRVSSRRKTNIPLLPRALAKKTTREDNDKKESNTVSDVGNKLSNDDFRNLLAKK